jgi:Beta-lactamase class C and other penicillin binding proteins
MNLNPLAALSGLVCSLLLGALAFAPTAASAADPVDDLMEARRKAQKIPGLSLVVIKEGKIVRAKGYGLARVEEPAVPATDRTVFGIASVTKQFTAVAVLMLVEDGKLSLDDTIGKHLDGLPESWRGVTVRQLLNHTSGIPSYTALPDYGQDPARDYTQRELIGRVFDKPMDFAPGTDWAYNNTGYYLLGMLIEKVTGKSYGAFLEERIFRPLGMADTRMDDRGAKIPRRAVGYTLEAEKVRPADLLSPTQPFAAGALLSTAQDLAKWDAALYTDKLLPKAAREAMWTPTKLKDGTERSYGFGWVVDTYRTRRRVHHSGGINGFSSYLTRFPDDRVTVIVLTNQDAADPGQIAHEVAAEYIPALKENAPKVIEDKDPATTARLKGVLTALAAGKEDPKDYTEGFYKFLFPEQAKELRGFLAAQGELKALELTASETQNGMRKLRYRVTFARQPVNWEVVLDGSGKVAGWLIRPE